MDQLALRLDSKPLTEVEFWKDPFHAFIPYTSYLQHLVNMAAEQQSSRRREMEQPERKERYNSIGSRLGEPGKFAYAALSAVSLALLFPEPEER